MIEIVWEQSAARDFDDLPASIKVSIEESINGLALDPFPASSIKLTAAGDQRRVRVGSYRVVYVVDANPRRIRIVTVGHRRNVYG